jgi:hypothetical protein
MAGICLIHSERGVLGIVDDYGSNYQRFHAVDIAILFFLDVHLIILIYFFVLPVQGFTIRFPTIRFAAAQAALRFAWKTRKNLGHKTRWLDLWMSRIGVFKRGKRHDALLGGVIETDLSR